MKMTNTAGPSPLSAAARFRPQTVQTGLTVRKPSKSGPVPHRGQRHRGPAAKGETGGCRSVIRSWGGAASTTPPVDADEQEQPHHVDEMPVPGGRLEPEMMVGLEMALDGTDQGHRQESRADDDVKAVEAGRHVEGRGIDAVLEAESGVDVFIGLQ